MALTSPHTAATTTTRNRYNRAARFYDLHQSMMELLLMRRLRTRLWQKAPAAGDILEIGVGTGVNIPYYPPAARPTAIDLSEKMLERASRRADRLHATANLVQMDAEHLDFPDATFDAVLSTCVFCSVPNPVAGLREAWRVLKPGGQLLLLEHMRSGNPVVGRLMDLMNLVVVRMSGANINRRTLDNLRAAGIPDIDAASHAFGIVKLIEARKPA